MSRDDFIARVIILALVVTCFSYQDIKNARCEVGCMRSGYDSGFEKNNKCECFDKIDTDVLLKKKLILPKKNIIKEESKDAERYESWKF